MKRMVRQFELVRDEHGHAMAVAVGGYFMIHLERGTVRNEENAGKLIDALNAAVACVHKECGVVGLRNALERFMPNKGGSVAASGTPYPEQLGSEGGAV